MTVETEDDPLSEEQILVNQDAERYFGPPAMSEDEQEALSVRYAQGIWLVPLTSGAWAIFGPDRKLVALPKTLDSYWLRSFAVDLTRRWDENMAEELVRAETRSPVQVARSNAEDLGL